MKELSINFIINFNFKTCMMIVVRHCIKNFINYDKYKVLYKCILNTDSGNNGKYIDNYK